MHTRLSSPAQTQFRFPARRYSRSRLNPQARYGSVLSAPSEKRISSSDESIRIHLSNLDKLIQKNTQPVLPDKTSKAATKKGLSLEGFDLGKILWRKAAATAEEMSPRHLNRLQRLLSNNSLEYSPRNNLGNRWREYHGSKDWVGLLDPLDENLRREVVRYGEFIQAAYQAFNNQPSVTDDGTSSSSSSSETAPPFQVTLLDKSYKVTKNLYSTSSIRPPDWVDDMAPNLGWLTQRSSWIGYVAVCDDQKEIARMGRRDIVIALRGTSTCLEWAENLRDGLIELPDHPSTDSIEPHKLEAKVECGFLSLYKTPGSDSPSLSESLMMEVQRLVQLYKGETLSISVTGHSLGAALAVLAGDELSNISTTHNIPLAVFSFGGPRVGNKGFANRITQNQVKVLRVVNAQDLITRVPGMLFNETLDEKLKTTGLVHDVPWAYSHVGSELRVDTKMSPYLKPNADVACCHDLEAYLHLVDGFSASDSPFRSNAKRSLLTLLSQQGSNVKKLYTSKVPAQKLNSRFMT